MCRREVMSAPVLKTQTHQGPPPDNQTCGPTGTITGPISTCQVLNSIDLAPVVAVRCILTLAVGLHPGVWGPGGSCASIQVVANRGLADPRPYNIVSICPNASVWGSHVP